MEVWATHEALRRLGFSAEDIFVSAQVMRPQDRKLCAGVVLRSKRLGLEFRIHVEECGEPSSQWLDRWHEFAERVVAGDVAIDVLNGAWERSWARAHIMQMAQALYAKGFTFGAPRAQ